MMRTIKLFLFILFYIGISSCTQKNTRIQKAGYTIDPDLEKEVDKRIAPFNLKANSIIYAKIFENGKAIASSFGNGEPALSFTNVIDNTIAINCLNGIEDGYGFALIINHDTSMIKFHLVSNTDSCLFRESGSGLMPQIQVNCSKSKIILAEKPGYNGSEVITGYVELESREFYKVTKDKESKLKFIVSSYFKSEPLPVKNNSYKTLKKQ